MSLSRAIIVPLFAALAVLLTLQLNQSTTRPASTPSTRPSGTQPATAAAFVASIRRGTRLSGSPRRCADGDIDRLNKVVTAPTTPSDTWWRQGEMAKSLAKLHNRPTLAAFGPEAASALHQRYLVRF
jgi:hypothetical protein